VCFETEGHGLEGVAPSSGGLYQAEALEPFGVFLDTAAPRWILIEPVSEGSSRGTPVGAQ
jgi:hypothetical protein